MIHEYWNIPQKWLGLFCPSCYYKSDDIFPTMSHRYTIKSSGAGWQRNWAEKIGFVFSCVFLKSFYPLQNIRVPRHLPKGRGFIDQLAITVPTVLPLISVVVTILLEYTAEGTDKHQ